MDKLKVSVRQGENICSTCIAKDYHKENLVLFFLHDPKASGQTIRNRHCTEREIQSANKHRKR